MQSVGKPARIHVASWKAALASMHCDREGTLLIKDEDSMHAMTFLADPLEEVLWPLNFVSGGFVKYTMPALLTGRALPAASSSSPIGDLSLNCLASFTLRLSRLHHEKRLSIGMAANGRVADWNTFKAASKNSYALDLTTILAMAALACDRPTPVRRDLTWVGGQSHATAWLVPPPSSALPGLMRDLTDFVSREGGKADVAELAEAILYQFIHIHPFSDGNGRTVRALLVWLALYRGSIDPLALVWLSIADKRSIGDAWRAGPADRCVGPSIAHLWKAAAALCVARVDQLSVNCTATSLCRAIEFSCCVGAFRAEELSANLSISRTLAAKVINSMEKLGWKERGGAWVNESLERDFFECYENFSQSISEHKECV